MRDGNLQLSPLREEDDAGAIVALLAEPEINRWWSDGDYDSEHGWIIEVAGKLAGWVQYHEEAYEWFPSVAFDIALTSALHGKGYGRRALRLVIEHFVAKGHHRFTIDPNPENERAVRCYEAVGFKPVGIMRAYARNPDRGWDDGLLMDLIVLEGQWT